VEEPVHVELYPVGSELPPALKPGSGPLGIAWWSLKLRWFAAHASQVPGRAPPRIRMFVLYHDPATLDRVPDSHGLQKGLVGIVHAFAESTMAGSNTIVIAHELLHTVGATDKYDLTTGTPLYPDGSPTRIKSRSIRRTMRNSWPAGARCRHKRRRCRRACAVSS